MWKSLRTFELQCVTPLNSKPMDGTTEHMFAWRYDSQKPTYKIRMQFIILYILLSSRSLPLLQAIKQFRDHCPDPGDHYYAACSKSACSGSSSCSVLANFFSNCARNTGLDVNWRGGSVCREFWENIQPKSNFISIRSKCFTTATN